MTVLTTVVLTAAFQQWWIALIGLIVVVGGLLFPTAASRSSGRPLPSRERHGS